MKNYILITLTNALGLYIASLLFPAITLSSIAAVLWAGLLLATISLFLKPLLLLISLPINFITFGLFTLLINAWLIQLSAYLAKGVSIPNFKYALIPAIIIFALNRARLSLIQDKS
nr:phage holin family protein [Desulforamulus aquiferis]